MLINRSDSHPPPPIIQFLVFTHVKKNCVNVSDIFTTVMKCLRVYVREAFPFRQSFIVFILF